MVNRQEQDFVNFVKKTPLLKGKIVIHVVYNLKS